MTPQEHHRLAARNFGPQRYFEDFVIGETFYIPSRTVTDGHFAASRRRPATTTRSTTIAPTVRHTATASCSRMGCRC